MLQPHLGKSIGEELIMDEEDILRHAITRTKKTEDTGARSEEQDGRKMNF